MRSFSVLATIACAALSYAAPLVNLKMVGTEVDPIVRTSAAVHVRAAQAPSDVIQDLNIQLAPLVAPLTSVTSQNATVESITDILQEVKALLGGAVNEVTTIAGGVTTPAGGLDGVLSLPDLAGLLATLLKLVFTALGAVLKVVTAADKAALQAILAEVAGLVVDFLKVVLPSLGGLVGLLRPLIGEVLPVVNVLGLAYLFDDIGLKP